MREYQARINCEQRKKIEMDIPNQVIFTDLLQKRCVGWIERLKMSCNKMVKLSKREQKRVSCDPWTVKEKQIWCALNAVQEQDQSVGTGEIYCNELSMGRKIPIAKGFGVFGVVPIITLKNVMHRPLKNIYQWIVYGYARAIMENNKCPSGFAPSLWDTAMCSPSVLGNNPSDYDCFLHNLRTLALTMVAKEKRAAILEMQDLVWSKFPWGAVQPQERIFDDEGRRLWEIPPSINTLCIA